jgi:hypothetical protein
MNLLMALICTGKKSVLQMLSHISNPDFIHPGSRIPDPTTATAEEGKKFVELSFFVATNITKLKTTILFLNK